MIKPLEFLICDETDNSGYSVMPWSEKEAKRQYGSCNVFHVIEKYEYDRLKAENARFREVLEYIANPKKIHDASIFSTKVYWDLAREALKGME